jgi:hypothetical protein
MVGGGEPGQAGRSGVIRRILPNVPWRGRRYLSGYGRISGGIRKNAGGGPAACLFPEKKVLFKKQERCMGVRIKPVEPTVIKDKAIIKQVIEEIRRKPSKATIARHKRMRENVMSMVRKCPE